MADVSNTQFYDLEPEQQPKQGLPAKKMAIVGGVIFGAVIVVLLGVFLVNSLSQRQPVSEQVTDAQRDMQRELDDCLENEDPAACQSRVRSNNAREMGDVAMCSGLVADEYHNCVELIAFDTLNQDICEALESGVDSCKDTVYTKTARANNDYAQCDQISDADKRKSCQSSLLDEVVEQGRCEEFAIDPEVCAAQSLFDQAIATRNIEECEALLPPEEEAACAEIIPTIADESVDSGLQDADGDGLSANMEATYGTSDNNKDSDADGVEDGDEVQLYLTDPANPDTDGDGFDDGTEILSGNDPLG